MKFKPEIGEEFYYITQSLDVQKAIYDNGYMMSELLNVGNCFRNFATAKVKAREMECLLKDVEFKEIAKPILLISIPRNISEEKHKEFKKSISGNSVNLSYHIIIEFKKIKDIEYKILSPYNNKIDLVKELGLNS